jgi:hypothetical protein
MTLATYNLSRKQLTSRVSWRKLLLSRREELLQRGQHFEELWHEAFPVHDPLTLQFKSRNKAETYWEGGSWKKAAHWYYDQRQGRADFLIVETPPEKLKLLRRLMYPGASLERAWNEVNDARNRATPAVAIEAVWLAVLERGLQHVPTAMNRDSQDTPEVRV